MREIIFRGKRKGDGKWVEGYYVMVDPVDMPDRIREPKAVIFPVYATCNWFNKYFYNNVEVLPETVGQFTGFCDENSRDVFEGDIVKGYNFLHMDRTIYKVVFAGNGFYYQDEDEVCWHPDNIDNDVVIGNIYDNPELLEAE